MPVLIQRPKRLSVDMVFRMENLFFLVSPIILSRLYDHDIETTSALSMMAKGDQPPSPQDLAHFHRLQPLIQNNPCQDYTWTLLTH